MRRSEFYYALPQHLIAQYPTANRRDSCLLYLDGATGRLRDLRFPQLLELVRPNDLLVFNDTRVIPARLFGHKSTGGGLEVLVERILDARRVLAQIRASKSPRRGSTIYLGEDVKAEVIERHDEFFELQFNDARSVLQILDAIGHIPLPPYINRPDEPVDAERYQTIYARRVGAVAAPTAGLHFDEALMASLQEMGVGMGYLTLHVGQVPSSRCASLTLQTTNCIVSTLTCLNPCVNTWMPPASAVGELLRLGAHQSER